MLVGFTKSFAPLNSTSQNTRFWKRRPWLGTLFWVVVRPQVPMVRAVASTHLQPGLDGAVPLCLPAPVLPEPLQFLRPIEYS